MSDISENNERLKLQRKCLFLNVTKVTKFGFAILFLSGAVYHHSGTLMQVEDFCQSIGRIDPADTFYEYRECYYDLKGGLLICGTIMLFVSIVTEAYIGVNMNGYCTMFHVFGYLFLMIASMTEMIIVKTKELILPNFGGGMWIAGGILTALCQGYLCFTWKAGGLIVITTFLCACIGSVLFIGFGISRINEVYRAFVVDDDDRSDYLNGSAGFIITGALLYVLHAILYSVSIDGKLIGITPAGEVEPTNVSNTTAYQQLSKHDIDADKNSVIVEDQQSSHVYPFELSLSPVIDFCKPHVDGFLILIVSARLGFCILFFSSGVLRYHPKASFDLKNGLIGFGGFLFFISVVTEATLCEYSRRAATFYLIGFPFFIFVSVPELLVENYDHNTFYEYYEGRVWLTSAFLTSLYQACVAYNLRSKGDFLVIMSLLAWLGSILYLVFGLLRVKEIADTYADVDHSGGFLIAGSVFYFLHACMFLIIAHGKMSTKDEPSPSVSSKEEPSDELALLRTESNPNEFKKKSEEDKHPIEV